MSAVRMIEATSKKKPLKARASTQTTSIGPSARTRSKSRVPGADPLNPGIPYTARKTVRGRVGKISAPKKTPKNVKSFLAQKKNGPVSANPCDQSIPANTNLLPPSYSRSTGSPKRPDTGDGGAGGDEQGDSKRPNGDELTGSNQDGGQEAIATEPSAPDPCAVFAAGLAKFQDLATGSASNVQDPVVQGQQLVDDTVFRAVAVVTEAISERGQGVQFSVLEPATVQEAHLGLEPTQTPTRPGNDVLIPWIPGDGHSSLYIVRSGGGSHNFDIRHFDSSSGFQHRAIQRGSDAATLIRTLLWTPTGWNQPGNNTIVVARPRSANTTRQNQNWECGIHVTLSAWAHALGLEPADQQQDRATYARFLQHAREIINLSLRGFMDSETIKSFLECYKFVRPGQTVSSSRTFDRTVAMERVTDYLQHNARVRIIADLDTMRAIDPDVPSLNDLLRGLEQFGDNSNLTGSTANSLVQMFNAYRASLMPVAAPTEPFIAPNYNDGAVNGTEQSPIDPAIVEQIVLAEAAEIRRLAAQQTAANGDTQAAPPGVEGHAPTQTFNSLSPGESPASKNSRPKSGSTASSFSGVDSDSDDGFFGDSGTAPTVTAVAPEAVESQDLVAFREEQVRRMERRLTAEARVEEARRLANPPPEDESTMASALAQSNNAILRLGSDDDPHQPEPDHPVPGREGRARGEEGVQQSTVADDQSGDNDNDSLFGEEPSAVPVPQPHPSGLSLPPTPVRATFPEDKSKQL